jgi:hypothetical protein
MNDRTRIKMIGALLRITNNNLQLVAGSQKTNK